MIAGPKVWNSLPSNIRAITNLLHFKKKLKTFFYRKALCKAPVNLLETERYINFNIIIVIIIIPVSRHMPKLGLYRLGWSIQ